MASRPIVVSGCVLCRNGGRTRARTWDPLIKSQLLYERRQTVQFGGTDNPVAQSKIEPVSTSYLCETGIF